jgi:hypothetical protein
MDLQIRQQQIKDLMAQPRQKRDLEWLQATLQGALELELSTLPPYLCGLYALKDQSSDAATAIRNIVYNEMCHFGLSCNLLRATGAQPRIFDGFDSVVYPGPLPGGVKPKHDSSLGLPCRPDFQVTLGFKDYTSFVEMCMQIEYPEDPVPRVAPHVELETFPTIGQFYNAVLQSFKNLGAGVPYQLDKQIENDNPKIVKIDGLQAATDAISLIQKQGEGAAKFPFTDENCKTLAHFYAFGEIYFGRRYVYDPLKRTGDWTGAEVSVPESFPMTPVPEGGYAAVSQEVLECDEIFTQMLRQLDGAWAKGDTALLGEAIGSMKKLKAAIIDLFKKQIERPEGGIYGPQFRKRASREFCV